VTVGIPFSRWGAKPFILRPIPFPVAIQDALAASNEASPTQNQPSTHVFLLARSWRQQLDREPGLSKAKIAAREGLSRARVTQVMNLLRLPSEIQSDLLQPPAPLQMHMFTERALRLLVSCPDAQIQAGLWRRLLEGLRVSAGN
jgi:hypothetical protein